MRILSIDPGYDRLGIAILEGNPSKPLVVWSDCIQPKKGVAEQRLAEVSRAVERAITLHKPDALALESLFFSTNVKTALKVAEARGAVLSQAGLYGLPVIECSPQQVKIAVTGHGGSDKKAIGRMVPKLVELSDRKRLDDELDAIAVGIAALAIGLPKGM